MSKITTIRTVQQRFFGMSSDPARGFLGSFSLDLSLKGLRGSIHKTLELRRLRSCKRSLGRICEQNTSA